MTDAREIIANGLSNHGMTFPSPDAVAVHLLNHLSVAGYRIIGPDEVAAIQKALSRAEDGAGTLPAKEAVKLRPADWHAIQDLIRALGRKA